MEMTGAIVVLAIGAAFYWFVSRAQRRNSNRGDQSPPVGGGEKPPTRPK